MFALLAMALGGVVLWSAPAQAQTATVLVKNTGQADAGAQALDTTNTKRAQAFTTGANAAGYTLSSIGFDFGSIADIMTAGAHLEVTLSEEGSDGNPGSVLCTLTDPAAFSGSGVQTFAAPTTGTECPTLAANKTYFAVIDRVTTTATATITLKLTSSASEDAGGATGWSIGDTLRTFTNSAWGRTPSRSYRVVVSGSVDNSLATGAPSISGVLQQDEVLTADTAGIADADGVGTLSYQWLADGTAISGATSSTYTLTASEVGNAISLTVSFTDDEGYSESLTSAATHAVVASGANRTLLWLGRFTPGDRGGGTVGFNRFSVGSLNPFMFTYGSDTYAIDILDFGPVPSSGLSITMNAFPAADEEEKWIFDTGREWPVSDIEPHDDGTQIFMLWAAVEEDVDWTVGEETVVYLLEVVNYPPVFTDTAPTTRSVDEDTASSTNIGAAVAATDGDNDTLVYGLTGTDSTSFSIDTTSGQLTTSASLDFETKSSYSVDVTVHDGKDGLGNDDTTVDATITVTISVNNMDEDGTVTLPATFTGGTEATATLSDPDGSVAIDTWKWARGDTSTGSFSDISGASLAAYTPVAADVGKYLRATATYKDGQSATVTKTARAISSSAVGASNSEPTFDDGAMTTRTLPENSGAGVNVGAAISATDGDSDTLTYSLTGTDAGSFEIDSNGQLKTKTGVTHNFNFEAAKKSYSVTVNVRDSNDAAGDADTVIDNTIAVTINLTDANDAPEITTGSATHTAFGVAENTATTMAIKTYQASDEDASSTLTWSLEGDDAGDFTITKNASGHGELKFASAPNFEIPADNDTDNDYVVTVKVEDDGTPAMSDTLEVTVTVTNVNEAPEITTTATTANVPENSTSVLTLTASDVDDSTTFAWSVESGDDGGKFDISSTGALTFKNAPDFEMPTDVGDTAMNNTYVVTVKVEDDGSPKMSDTHTITVMVTDANDAPEITTTATTASVAENSTAVLMLAASDVDASDTLAWSVEPADDGSKFTIDSSGALTFTNAPDFETPTQSGSTSNTYVVTVKVADSGGLSDTHQLTVTVSDVNETPSITSGPSTIAKDENTQTTESIATYVATDPDATTGTMSWALEGNDAGDFTITSTVNGTANLFFAASPNFESAADTGTDNVYDVTVRVRDNGSPRLQDTRGVAITVEDVNETPVVGGDDSPDFAEIEYDATSAELTISTYTYTDEDRNPADTITWGLSGTDAAHFNIGSASGVLSFNIRPDFENPFGADNQYLVEVEADDGQGGVGTFNVTVTVTNVDETPEITTTAASHTVPSFVEIEYDAETADLDLVVADYEARDEEHQTITWSRTGADAGDFTIDSTTGVLSFAQRPNFEMPADGDADNAYNVTVRASDTASTANVRELEVVVTVTDVNERPDIDEGTVPSYVEIEYDFTGTRPDVHTFTATDYDDMDTFEWSLLGTDAAHLEIGATSGVLTFAQDAGFGRGPLPNFDHPRDDDGDGSNTYSITVRATDDDATDQKFSDYAVVVTVTDVNEAPEFTGTPETALTPDEHDANDDYVVVDLADYDARDEELGVTWSLTGTDSGDFAVSADGVVTFDETPNYEAPEDSGGDNVYEFTVVATDVQSGTSRRNVSQAVTVTVGDVEEAGTVTVDNLSPAVSQTLTFRLTDPDGGIDLTVDQNLGSPINWRLESLASGGSWTQVFGLSFEVSTTFRYTVDEDVTGKALRAVVTYTDRRGSGKMAVSEETAAVTRDPIANAPPRFRGGSIWNVEEGPADRAIGPRITATDRDNDTLTYGIQSGQDAASFEINPSTGPRLCTKAR